MHALLLLSPESLHSAYTAAVQAKIRAHASSLSVICPSDTWKAHLAELKQADVIFSGWGAPLMDREFLAAAPALRAVFYAGGTVRDFVTEAFWERGIRLTTAQAINAIPVSEFAVAALTLGLKRVWHYANVTRQTRDFPSERPMPGAYGSTVGLVSYGIIARMTRQRLRQLEVKVIVYDPFLSDHDAAREGVRKVQLDELFQQSDAVSVHTPKLPETRRLIKGRHVAALRQGSFFLNTARGEVLDEQEIAAVLGERPDIQAMLDVTSPEPPLADSPLYSLPNVFLTPHIAGSVGAECERMGLAMVEEFDRFRAGDPLRWEISAEAAERLA